MSRQLKWALVLIGAVTAAGLAKETDRQEIRKSYTYRKGQTVIVDNVYGGITVEGHSGNTVELKAIRSTTARDKSWMAKANEEVILDVTEDAELLEFYIDGPFRWHDGRMRRRHHASEEDYKVIFDFVLRVPEDASVKIKTVMEGDIRATGLKGAFDVQHVNGPIAMEHIQGWGEAYSVNGDVTLDFDKNPGQDCRFGALNGQVRMNFRKGLNADFELKTFNGDFFTDFEVTDTPSRVFNEVKRNGKTVYKAGHLTTIRAGRGGPVIRLDGFNGDMYILNKDKR